MSVSAAYWNNNSLLVLSTDSIDLMRNCKANDCYRLICNRIFCAWFSIRSLASLAKWILISSAIDSINSERESTTTTM